MSTTNTSTAFGVPAASPYKSVEDVIAECRKDPGNITVGSLWRCRGQDALMMQFLKQLELISQRLNVMFKGASAARPHSLVSHKAGVG